MRKTTMPTVLSPPSMAGTPANGANAVAPPLDPRTWSAADIEPSWLTDAFLDAVAERSAASKTVAEARRRAAEVAAEVEVAATGRRIGRLVELEGKLLAWTAAVSRLESAEDAMSLPADTSTVLERAAGALTPVAVAEHLTEPRAGVEQRVWERLRNNPHANKVPPTITAADRALVTEHAQLVASGGRFTQQWRAWLVVAGQREDAGGRVPTVDPVQITALLRQATSLRTLGQHELAKAADYTVRLRKHDSQRESWEAANGEVTQVTTLSAIAVS
jgi:hypothetical protein